MMDHNNQNCWQYSFRFVVSKDGTEDEALRDIRLKTPGLAPIEAQGDKMLVSIGFLNFSAMKEIPGLFKAYPEERHFLLLLNGSVPLQTINELQREFAINFEEVELDTNPALKPRPEVYRYPYA